MISNKRFLFVVIVRSGYSVASVSTSGSRRKFLKTIGSAAVVSALPRIAPASQSSQAPSRSVVVFWEPGFPEIQGLRSEERRVGKGDWSSDVCSSDLQTLFVCRHCPQWL